MTPIRFGAMPYPQFEGRIRSMTYETAPGNTEPVEYSWPNIKPGTYLYHSGTHIQCHVQMGLYGAVTQDAAAGEAYPGEPYDKEVVLLFSEIDPVFHQTVADVQLWSWKGNDQYPRLPSQVFPHQRHALH